MSYLKMGLFFENVFQVYPSSAQDEPMHCGLTPPIIIFYFSIFLPKILLLELNYMEMGEIMICIGFKIEKMGPKLTHIFALE